jgi:hypothetical protein
MVGNQSVGDRRDGTARRAEQKAYSRWDNEGGAPRGARHLAARIVSSVASRPSGRADDPMTRQRTPEETSMYIGGGILGTILLIVLIVYFVRRI